jgi:hypothetical protein
MNFDYPNAAVLLKAPWTSAYTQGLVISALVRAWRLTKRPQLIELLQGSAKVFELDVKDRGVRILLDGHTLYTETPGGPPPGILDGFLTSLIGLYDLHLETNDPVVGRCFARELPGSSMRFHAGTTAASGVGITARFPARLLITT